MRFIDRSVIVTGAAGGIGRAIAGAFAAERAAVVLVDRDAEACESVAARLHASGARAWAHVCDLADAESARGIVERCVALTGRLDVVVNNAAVMPHRPLVDLTIADWRSTLDVNLLAPALLIGEALKHLRAGGSIVNVASVHAYRAQPDAAPYAASKAALLALTRAADTEGRARGVRANAVVPGAIDAGLLWSNPAVASGAERIDPADVGRPDDVAAAVTFLASDDAAFIRGAALAVDGGRLARL